MSRYASNNSVDDVTYCLAKVLVEAEEVQKEVVKKVPVRVNKRPLGNLVWFPA